MDVGAFVQENRRWLLGCAIGGVAWWIATAVVGSVYKAELPNAKALGLKQDTLYDQAALTNAQTENVQLLAERQRLQQALAFVQSDRYLPANKGSLDEYLLQVGRDLRQAIALAANQREVQLPDGTVSWDAPTNVDDRRSTLFGLELLDEVQQRLFAAHDATRALSEDSIGLRAVLSLKLDARRGQKSQVRTPRAGEVDVRDFLTQEQVSFQFQSDEATALAFYEACRKPGRTLVVDFWQLLKPAKPGEACTVKGTLLGLVFKEGGSK